MLILFRRKCWRTWLRFSTKFCWISQPRPPSHRWGWTAESLPVRDRDRSLILTRWRAGSYTWFWTNLERGEGSRAESLVSCFLLKLLNPISYSLWGQESVRKVWDPSWKYTAKGVEDKDPQTSHRCGNSAKYRCSSLPSFWWSCPSLKWRAPDPSPAPTFRGHHPPQ